MNYGRSIIGKILYRFHYCYHNKFHLIIPFRVLQSVLSLVTPNTWLPKFPMINISNTFYLKRETLHNLYADYLKHSFSKHCGLTQVNKTPCVCRWFLVYNEASLYVNVSHKSNACHLMNVLCHRINNIVVAIIIKKITWPVSLGKRTW